MDKDAKKDTKKASPAKDEGKVRKGEELLAVLKEILSDSLSVLEKVDSVMEWLDALDAKVTRALPPSPGRFTRL